VGTRGPRLHRRTVGGVLPDLDGGRCHCDDLTVGKCVQGGAELAMTSVDSPRGDHADLSGAQLADRLAIRDLVDADAYRFTGAATGQG
jgi:hypothetical protein